ncbi:hypothetical protein [Burkholderia sp. WTPI3]|uniref:hypothetical protein n=1 Tax=Burkholderia sp. WTPI3 TaxID=2822167 RepID=UPI001F404603|nr:hypothetical protein [Burkholderia sp. WTPI3]
MAFYKYGQYLSQEQTADFDQIHHPGTPTPYSGIYRCEGCGQSIVSTKQHPLPAQNHHQHTFVQGAIRWRMIVRTHFA